MPVESSHDLHARSQPERFRLPAWFTPELESEVLELVPEARILVRGTEGITETELRKLLARRKRQLLARVRRAAGTALASPERAERRRIQSTLCRAEGRLERQLSDMARITALPDRAEHWVERSFTLPGLAARAAATEQTICNLRARLVRLDLSHTQGS